MQKYDSEEFQYHQFRIDFLKSRIVAVMISDTFIYVRYIAWYAIRIQFVLEGILSGTIQGFRIFGKYVACYDFRILYL